MSKIKYDIDPKIIAKTKSCDRDFECLTKPLQPSCTVSDCINGKIHFLNKLERDCRYHMDFGFQPVCLCPVRQEIFRKYGE